MLEFARYTASVLEIALVVRVLAAGLGKRVPFFLAYLIADLAGAAFAAPFSVSSHAYRIIWITRQPIFVLTSILAAGEAIYRLTEGYPRFSAKRRSLGFVCGSLGLIVGLWITWPHRLSSALSWAYFGSAFAAVAVFVAMAAANVVFSFAPAPARRNSLVHAQVFALFTVVNVSSLYLMSRWHMRDQIGFSIAAGCCFVAWMVRLTPAGEKGFVPLPPMTDQEEADDLAERMRDLSVIADRIDRAR